MEIFSNIEPKKSWNEELLFKFLRKDDHNVSSFNVFLQKSLKEIIKSNYNVSNINGIKTKIFFKNITYINPTYSIGNKLYPLYPAKARKDYLTYEITIKADIYKSEETDDENWSEPELIYNNQNITKLPIMVGCCCCNLIKYNIPLEEYPKYGEDSEEKGGYFIIKGKEKKLNMQEQLTLDRIIINDTKRNKANIKSLVSTRILTSSSKSGTHLNEIYRYEKNKKKNENLYDRSYYYKL